MTPEEHRLHVLVLARVYQSVNMVIEALKSRDILSSDDISAFNFAAWADDQQIIVASVQARADYLRLAALAGVEVPEEF